MEAQVTALETRLNELCGHLNVLHAELVDLVADALTDDLWNQGGIRSPEHWLAWKTGVAPETARRVVTTARRRDDLPITFQTFQHGELSLDQVAVVAKHTRPAHDAQVADLARHATVSQLRVALGRYQHEPKAPSTSEPAPAPAPAEQPCDTVSFGHDDNQRFQLHANLNAADGALVEQALREARDHLFQQGVPNVTWADALTEICTRSLSTVTAHSRRSQYRVYVHVDTEGAWLQAGPSLPPSIIERIACDGVIQPVWHTDGLPVNIGRAQHIFPPHTRRLILDRDRHCRTPGCCSTIGLEVHHITHWNAGGNTDTANGATQCSRHHDDIHQGLLHVTGNADLPDGLTFTDQHGRPIPAGAQPKPPTGPPPAPPPGHHYSHPTGERFNTLWFNLNDPPTAAA